MSQAGVSNDQKFYYLQQSLTGTAWECIQDMFLLNSSTSACFPHTISTIYVNIVILGSKQSYCYYFMISPVNTDITQTSYFSSCVQSINSLLMLMSIVILYNCHLSWLQLMCYFKTIFFSQ